MAFSSQARSAVLALGFLGAGVGLGVYGPAWLARAGAPLRAPDVVSQVRELSRLEGVRYHIERVVELQDEQRHLLGLLAAQDAILLVASGDVIAGVDLAKLEAKDVSISPDRRSVTIRLPPAEIFSSRLDNERTHVRLRQTDLLAVRQESLETQARQTAEQTLRSAAEESGIVKRAGESVARTVEALVRSLGFEAVRVDAAES